MPGEANTSGAQSLNIGTGTDEPPAHESNGVDPTIEEVTKVTPEDFEGAVTEAHIEVTFTIEIPTPDGESLAEAIDSVFATADWIKGSRDIAYDKDVTVQDGKLEVTGTGVLMTRFPHELVSDSKSSVKTLFTDHQEVLINDGNLELRGFTVPPFYTFKSN